MHEQVKTKRVQALDIGMSLCWFDVFAGAFTEGVYGADA
jgi:hypothetical protein